MRTAYDPNTDRFVISWLDNGNRIAFQTVSAVNGSTSQGRTLNVRATDAPAVTCAARETPNCLVTIPVINSWGSCAVALRGYIGGPPGVIVDASVLEMRLMPQSARYCNHHWAYQTPAAVAGPDQSAPYLFVSKWPFLSSIALSWASAAIAPGSWHLSGILRSDKGPILTVPISSPALGNYGTGTSNGFIGIFLQYRTCRQRPRHSPILIGCGPGRGPDQTRRGGRVST